MRPINQSNIYCSTRPSQYIVKIITQLHHLIKARQTKGAMQKPQYWLYVNSCVAAGAANGAICMEPWEKIKQQKYSLDLVHNTSWPTSLGLRLFVRAHARWSSHVPSIPVLYILYGTAVKVFFKGKYFAKVFFKGKYFARLANHFLPTSCNVCASCLRHWVFSCLPCHLPVPSL